MGIPASPKMPRTNAACRRPEWVNHAGRAKADARRGEARRSECATQVQREGAEGPAIATKELVIAGAAGLRFGGLGAR